MTANNKGENFGQGREDHEEVERLMKLQEELQPINEARYEITEDPNFFWIEIPATTVRINFDLTELNNRGQDYLDEIALQIDDYIPTNKPLVIFKHEISENVSVIGGSLFFFARMPSYPPQVFIGSRDHLLIQQLLKKINS